MSRCIPSINPNLPIPELIKILKHSVQEADFLEVERILIERDKKMRIQIEKLQMENLDVGGLENLKENLRRNQEITSLGYKLVKMGEDLKESAKALDELRVRNRDCDDECKFEARIMKVEGALAKMLNVEVEDLAKLVANLEKSGGGGAAKNLDFDSEKITFGAQAAGDVIEIHDDDNAANTTHVSDTSSEQMNKRKGRDCPLNLIRKTKKRICLSDQEDSDEESSSSSSSSSYSDGYMDHLVASIQKIG